MKIKAEQKGFFEIRCIFLPVISYMALHIAISKIFYWCLSNEAEFVCGEIATCILAPFVVLWYNKITKNKAPVLPSKATLTAPIIQEDSTICDKVLPKNKLNSESIKIFASLTLLSIFLAVSSAFALIYFNLAENEIKFNFISFLCVVLATPISEELIYRGFVLYRSKNFYGPFTAIAISSVLFAIAHPSVLSIFVSLFAGFIFCMACLKYNCVATSIYVHSLVNLLAFSKAIYSLPLSVYILCIIGLLAFSVSYIRNFYLSLKLEK